MYEAPSGTIRKTNVRVAAWAASIQLHAMLHRQDTSAYELSLGVVSHSLPAHAMAQLRLPRGLYPTASILRSASKLPHKPH